MNFATLKSRQPRRKTWTKEQLIHERALALRDSIDSSTAKSYGSALNSYLSFVRNHDLSVQPSEDNFSFFIVYMSHHINPKSVNTYLSGVCQQLEPYFPNVREVRNSKLVKRTLHGCMRRHGKPTSRKSPLTLDHLGHVILALSTNPSHDELLFLSMLLTGFFGLMRLGELTFPDDPDLQNIRKVSLRESCLLYNDRYEFFLPSHKADRYFEGNKIIITKNQFRHNPLLHMALYLQSRDELFPSSGPLWLDSQGNIPRRSFFMSRLRHFFPQNFAGQSMRCGGATSLAEHGVPPSIIQPLGRWSSQAFLVYIRKNPALIQGLLYGRKRDLDLQVNSIPLPAE